MYAKKKMPTLSQIACVCCSHKHTYTHRLPSHNSSISAHRHICTYPHLCACTVLARCYTAQVHAGNKMSSRALAPDTLILGTQTLTQNHPYFFQAGKGHFSLPPCSGITNVAVSSRYSHIPPSSSLPKSHVSCGWEPIHACLLLSGDAV